MERFPDDMQLIALNHAATSLALEFAKLQVLEDNTRIMDSNLFIDLMTGNIKLADEADYRAQMLRWPGVPLRIAVADIDDFEAASLHLQEEDIQQLKEGISSCLLYTSPCIFEKILSILPYQEVFSAYCAFCIDFSPDFLRK